MLTQEDITVIIPSYNNLRHLKNVYASLLRHAPKVKIFILDDASTDGTQEWVNFLPKDKLHYFYKSNERLGHTILYDRGISLSSTRVVSILHADMIIGPNYFENVLKHLKPRTVVCGTRVEPPLHPEGKEKIVKDFGMDFDSLNTESFDEYSLTVQSEESGKTTRGMFAPWTIYKEDFQAVGGHDKLFAPFPYEDSDIFQRWMMAGYELVQSRDALVYHLTCRGHRWNEQIGVEDDYFKMANYKAGRNYWRKWGSWIKNDEYQCPIIPKKYDVGIVFNPSDKYDNTIIQKIAFSEPFCSNLYVNYQYEVDNYLKLEQPNTLMDLSKRVLVKSETQPHNDVLIYINPQLINHDSVFVLQNIQDILSDSGGVGEFELLGMKLIINKLEPIEMPIKPMFSTI
jgi:glycosyltransferase involved in cell wall biosynthesis